MTISGGSALNILKAEKMVSLNKKEKSKITLREVEKTLMYISNNWKKFEKNWNKIIKIIHPFDALKSKINLHSKIAGKKFHPTNAFMKMYEGMIILNEMGWLNKQNKITMFDIASAPGMFILAVEKYLEIYEKELELDWFAMSFVPKGKTSYLQDDYGIYKANPDRFLNANILEESDIEKMLKINKEFNLVTGDIGMVHGFDELQEKQHHELQWGQAYVATKLCKLGGAVYLKMYSHIYATSMYLLQCISKCFKYLYIVKPFTSRIMNHESYILGVERNKNKLEMTPILKKRYEEDDINENIRNVCRNFHYRIVKEGNEAVEKANDCINKHIRYVDKDEKYKDYLMNLFKSLEHER